MAAGRMCALSEGAATRPLLPPFAARSRGSVLPDLLLRQVRNLNLCEKSLSF